MILRPSCVFGFVCVCVWIHRMYLQTAYFVLTSEVDWAVSRLFVDASCRCSS